MNGISTPLKEAPESSLALVPCEDTPRGQPSMNQEVGLYQIPNLSMP